jgi:hypothetical protein
LATRESLKSRASRKLSLEQVVPFYNADALRVRLQNSVERLGSYEADSNFSDPRLMAAYTLNQLDRANYQEQQIQDADANARTGYLYVRPSRSQTSRVYSSCEGNEMLRVRALVAIDGDEITGSPCIWRPGRSVLVVALLVQGC